MTFKIIKNAELPRKRVIYPFDKMEIGDGFDAPDDQGKYKNGISKRYNRINVSAKDYVKRHNPNAKFAMRRLNKTTIRCVRIR